MGLVTHSLEIVNKSCSRRGDTQPRDVCLPQRGSDCHGAAWVHDCDCIRPHALSLV